MEYSYTSSHLPLEPTTFGQKLEFYLKKNPTNYDVIFCVGPQKIQIKTLKIALKATSPEFEKLFRTKWDKGIGTIDGMISLPHFDPTAFQILLQLLYSDNLTTEDVTSMRLPFDTLNNLCNIAYELEIWNYCMWFKLDRAKTKLLSENFSTYIVSREFYQHSRETLDEIFGSEHITLRETTLFEAACKWAERRCIQNEMEPTGENMRETLGDALYNIRFSRMSSRDFLCFVCPKNILTTDEKERILESIQLDEQKKENKIDLSDFNTLERRLRLVNKSATINFFGHLGVVNDPPFICDGMLQLFRVQMSKTILLESVGFLGPIEANGEYDVKLRVTFTSGTHLGLSEELITEMQTKVQAERLTIFHVRFPKPIILEGTLKENIFRKCHGYYTIEYYLKGLNTQIIATSEEPSNFRFYLRKVEGVKFNCEWTAFQLVELRLRRKSLDLAENGQKGLSS